MIFVGQGKRCLHSWIMRGPFSIACITHLSDKTGGEGLPSVMHP